MNISEIDAKPVTEPLKGVELTRWFGNLEDLKRCLRSLLVKRALVCLSPNRHERCDTPATGIFWQDQAEWYPCCDAHWPSQSQWCGSTRFRGGYIALNCFDERLDYAEINVHPLNQGGDKVERYDRSQAT